MTQNNEGSKIFHIFRVLNILEWLFLVGRLMMWLAKDLSIPNLYGGALSFLFAKIIILDNRQFILEGVFGDGVVFFGGCISDGVCRVCGWYGPL